MDSLRKFLSDRTDLPSEISGSEPVGGGCIHDARKVRTSAGILFVKSAPGENNALLDTEAGGLREIRATGTVKVPEVLAFGSESGTTFLVLEWLDLKSLGSSSGRRLGERLAALHRSDQPATCGWETDNFIGSTPQINDLSEDWPRFFATRRLEPQFRLARDNGYRLPSAEPLLGHIEAFFPETPPGPSALHGDLWGGNASATAAGEPVLFDPAFYRGDPETDLAFSRFFGGFPAAFYRAYEEIVPPRPGWKIRQTLYNLYHVVNHLNLFGPSYEGQSCRMIAELNDRVRGG